MTCWGDIAVEYGSPVRGGGENTTQPTANSAAVLRVNERQRQAGRYHQVTNHKSAGQRVADLYVPPVRVELTLDGVLNPVSQLALTCTDSRRGRFVGGKSGSGDQSWRDGPGWLLAAGRLA